MTCWDVAVNLAVDQKHWNFRRGDHCHRRDLFQVESIFPTGIEKSDLDNGPQECSSQPWAGVKELSHAIEANLPKIRERRLSNHRAEHRIAAYRLQELGSTHGLAETEDAPGVQVCLKPASPVSYVSTFKQTIGCDCTVALSVRSGIGHQHGVAVIEKQLGIADHADTVVAESVQHEDHAAVVGAGLYQPRFQEQIVFCSDGNIPEIRSGAASEFLRVAYRSGIQEAALRMQSHFGYFDARDGTKDSIEQQSRNYETQATVHRSSLSTL